MDQVDPILVAAYLFAGFIAGLNYACVVYLQGGTTSAAESVMFRLVTAFCCLTLYLMYMANDYGPLWIVAAGVFLPGAVRLAKDAWKITMKLWDYVPRRSK